MPDLAHLDWHALDRLRATFLARDAASKGPYWQNHDTLAAYDATYAERIGWKWDTLLHELLVRRWSPPASTTLLDFGCGSGVAGCRVLSAFGPAHFTGLTLADHSPEAVAFAATRARETFPGLTVSTLSASSDLSTLDVTSTTLVISHVLNELTPEARITLLALAARAAAVIWVEPGTHADSRALAAVREELRPAHRIIAPCTHRENCPLFAEKNARDWCHFFAEPPPGVQNSPDWVRFSHRAGLDLRSQAYSCLVLERAPTPAADAAPPASPTQLVPARVLGRPEVFKPYARLLACDSTGLHFLELSKRTDPALVKRLGKKPPIPLYALTHDGETITSAHPTLSD
jgi:SAM-dependent methyltransferase